MNERNEVIKLNGLTILVVMVLIANFLVIGFFYRFHHYQLFVEEKKHNIEMTELEGRQKHDLKNEIVSLEGVKSWSETQYARSSRIRE